MEYLFYVNQWLTTTNKLQSAVKEMIHQHNRTLVDGNKLALFQDKLISAVEELNKKFPKCKPITISFWKNPHSAVVSRLERVSYNDWLIDQPDFIRGYFLACKEVVANG